MKKSFAVIISVLLIIGVICGCGGSGGGIGTQNKVDYQNSIENKKGSYPFYDSLDAEDKELYVELCTTIKNYNKNSVELGEYDSSREARAATKELGIFYRNLVFENPEYFWVDPYTFTINEIQQGDKYRLTLNVSYIVEEDSLEEKKADFNKKITEIVAGANAQANDFDKVLFVYDYILNNAKYDDELVKSDDTADLGRSAYGCLIDGETICSGYSMAFNIIMRELGIESGFEFNNYDEFSIISGHVWNYCKLENEYYYFDLTWDDTIFDSEDYKKHIDHGHMYFAITKDELSKTNFTMVPNAPTPACNGTKYNFFVHKNWNFAEYNYDAVAAAIYEQAGNKYVEIRFDSYGELLSAESELMKDGKIFEILKGKENIRYVISKASLHLYIFFD